jgi:hypothetical protein
MKNQVDIEFSAEEDKRIEKINIIGQKEVNQLWSIYNPREDYNKPRFPQKALKEIIKESNYEFDYNDYFIIYLSGLSIKEMRAAKQKGIRFITQELAKKEYDKKGVGGFYLVKLKRTYLQDLTPNEQDYFGIIPKNWRRANIREAAEILLNIFLIIREKYYLKEWHICYGEEDKNGKKVFNMLKFSSQEKITFFTRKRVSKNYELNSLTIRKAL